MGCKIHIKTKHDRCEAWDPAENQVVWLFFVSKSTGFPIDASHVFSVRGWIRTAIFRFWPVFHEKDSKCKATGLFAAGLANIMRVFSGMGKLLMIQENTGLIS